MPFHAHLQKVVKVVAVQKAIIKLYGYTFQDSPLQDNMGLLGVYQPIVLSIGRVGLMLKLSVCI